MCSILGTYWKLSTDYYYYYYKSRWLKWHYHIKDVAGTLYKIKRKEKRVKRRLFTVQLLTVSGNVQRLPNDRNRCAFVSRRNCSSELEERVTDGSPFQAQAAAIGNAWSSRVERRIGGTCNIMVSVERRRQRARTSAVSWRLSAR